MKRILLVLLTLFAITEGYSQVGINILNPDSSAVLQLESNKKGLGLPRLTSVQMNGIVNPLKGLTIFNTEDSVVEYWNGECWLKAWEKNCYYCDFQMTINPVADTLDRVVDDSIFATVTLAHTHGTGQINTTWTAVPPAGVQIYQQGPNIIDTSGSFQIVVKADVFAGSGNVPILITAYCGDQVRFVTYNVYIKPCVIVDIPMDDYNYDVQTRNSTLLPPGARECVLLTVFSGVNVHSNDPALPSLTIGNLDPLSIVGITNNGSILARGGDGGGVTTTTAGGQPGGNGGNALNLTTRTVMHNFGQIYAGGGGGGSVGYSWTSPSIPIIGSISLGFGSGGGGGSENGQGGGTPSGVSLGFYAAGNSATSGVNSVPGQGGQITTTIPISISVATINITPNVVGGNGGAYAQPGTGTTFNVNVQICVSIPFIGTVCPVSLNLPIPTGGAPGTPGLAVKRNGNTMQGLADGNYNSFQVKGTVAP